MNRSLTSTLPILSAVLPTRLVALVSGARRRVFESIDNLRRRWMREDEERRAIAHLRQLTDAQLRDMGITREEIVHAVRFGRATD